MEHHIVIHEIRHANQLINPNANAKWEIVLPENEFVDVKMGLRETFGVNLDLQNLILLQIDYLNTRFRLVKNSLRDAPKEEEPVISIHGQKIKVLNTFCYLKDGDIIKFSTIEGVDFRFHIRNEG